MKRAEVLGSLDQLRRNLAKEKLVARSRAYAITRSTSSSISIGRKSEPSRAAGRLASSSTTGRPGGYRHQPSTEATMAIHQSPGQKRTVERVMHEFNHGELKTARGARKVNNPEQAIAIALHEAGASNQESSQSNARNLRLSKSKERRHETTRTRPRVTARPREPMPAQWDASGAARMQRSDARRPLRRGHTQPHPRPFKDE
jgi:hypothetical protein